MVHTEIIEKVNTVLMDEFEIPREQLIPDAHLFEGLGLDSLDAIDMLVYLEENLHVRINGEIFKDVRTLGDIYRLVGNLADSGKLQA